MKILKFQWDVFLVNLILFHLVNTDSEEGDFVTEVEEEDTQPVEGDPKIEKAFKKFHPNWVKAHETPWPELTNLTAAALHDICTQVLFDIYRSHATAERFCYTHPKNGSLERRVLRKAAVKFSDEGIQHLTLLKCLYRSTDFYLARGDGKNVFRLERDSESKPTKFYFHDGPHPIKYPNI